MIKIRPAMVKKILVKHGPVIMTGFGITGMIVATVMAVRETPKALVLIEEEKKKQKEDLTPVTMVKTTWKCYLPSVMIGGFSIACVIGGQHASLRRNAALAAAYSLSEAAFKEYRDKNIELFGEKKDKEVYGKIAEDKVTQNPPKREEVIITRRGNSLCYEPLSNQYFFSTIDQIQKVENTINKRLMSEMFISLNEFLSELQIYSTNLGLLDRSVGDGVGWNVEQDLINIDFDSIIVPDGTYEGEPCIVLRYHIAPRNDYMSKER